VEKSVESVHNRVYISGIMRSEPGALVENWIKTELFHFSCGFFWSMKEKILLILCSYRYGHPPNIGHTRQRFRKQYEFAGFRL